MSPSTEWHAAAEITPGMPDTLPVPLFYSILARGVRSCGFALFSSRAPRTLDLQRILYLFHAHGLDPLRAGVSRRDLKIRKALEQTRRIDGITAMRIGAGFDQARR